MSTHIGKSSLLSIGTKSSGSTVRRISYNCEGRFRAAILPVAVGVRPWSGQRPECWHQEEGMRVGGEPRKKNAAKPG